VGAQLRQLAGPELRRVGWISTDQTMSARMPPRTQGSIPTRFGAKLPRCCTVGKSTGGGSHRITTGVGIKFVELRAPAFGGDARITSHVRSISLPGFSRGPPYPHRKGWPRLFDGPVSRICSERFDQLGPYFLCYHAGGLLEMSKLRRALSEGSPPHPNFFTATWAQRLKAGVILGRPGQHSLSPALPYFGTGNNGSTSS
jgi:hypothetical protein